MSGDNYAVQTIKIDAAPVAVKTPAYRVQDAVADARHQLAIISKELNQKEAISFKLEGSKLPFYLEIEVLLEIISKIAPENIVTYEDLPRVPQTETDKIVEMKKSQNGTWAKTSVVLAAENEICFINEDAIIILAKDTETFEGTRTSNAIQIRKQIKHNDPLISDTGVMLTMRIIEKNSKGELLHTDIPNNITITNTTIHNAKIIKNDTRNIDLY